MQHLSLHEEQIARLFKKKKSSLVRSSQQAGPELSVFISYQGRKLWFDSGAKSTSVFHICAAVNPDIVKLLTLKRLLGPAGSSKHGCYGKSTSCASEKTEILTSLHMIPSLVIGSAGSSGPAFEVCQIASLSPCQHSVRLI